MHPLTQPLVPTRLRSGAGLPRGIEAPAAAPAPSWEMVKKLKDPDYDRQVLLETLHEVLESVAPPKNWAAAA